MRIIKSHTISENAPTNVTCLEHDITVIFLDIFTHHLLSHHHHIRANKYISLSYILVRDELAEDDT